MPKDTILQFGEGGMPLQAAPVTQTPSNGNVTRMLIVATVIVLGVVAIIKYINVPNGKGKQSEL